MEVDGRGSGVLRRALDDGYKGQLDNKEGDA